MVVMDRRRAMMGNKEERLPDLYRAVEYIQSDSLGEYIDTGFVGNMGTCVEMKFNLLSSTGSPAVIGSRIDSNRFAFPTYFNGFDLAIGDDHSVGTWKKGTVYRAKIVTNPAPSVSSRMDVYGPDNYYVFTETDTKINNNLPLFIFRYNRNGAADGANRSSLRLYYLKLYDGAISKNAMVRNFIPCVRKADVKPGMYDTVTKSFYTNAGTSEFIVPN